MLVAAGCGGGQAALRGPVPAWRDANPLAVATAPGSGPSWAVLPMGGRASQHEGFWQLFLRPSGSAGWKLVTPPGVADNGGLVVAGRGNRPLTAGIVPSQLLTFTALATTRDDGMTWSPGLLRARMTAGPDALAASPSGQLIAVTARSAVTVPPGGRSWQPLATVRSVAAAPRAGRCGLERLTGTAFGSAGQPLLAGQCARPGQAAIFARAGPGWRLDGPALPGALARTPVTVIRLVGTGGGAAALLGAGTSDGEAVIPAWSDGSGSWTIGPVLRLHPAALESASADGNGWAVVLSGRRGVVLAGPGQSWQPLPVLPAGTAALAAGPGVPVAALATHGAVLGIWHRAGSGWQLAQTLTVPIPYGSSG